MLAGSILAGSLLASDVQGGTLYHAAVARVTHNGVDPRMTTATAKNVTARVTHGVDPDHTDIAVY